jgi:UDP-2,3-diacylglucosamine pyrophosphatase LpxH
MRTLVLSDLHLGNKNCHAEQILEVLQREPCERLILNGDTVNNLNLRKLRAKHWAVLDRLRALARSRELILVRGNHDHDVRHQVINRNGQANGNGNGNGHPFGAHDVLPALLGVPMVEDYTLELGGRRYLVMHGDRFDPLLNYHVMSDMAEWCYQVSQKVNKKLAKWLKKKSKKWGGVLEIVRSQSVVHARKQGFEGVLTGHTHYADDVHVEGIHYVNTGCWTEPPCTYVTIDSDRVRLHFVPD